MSKLGSVSASVVGQIGYIEFDNRQKRNAMSVAMWRALPEVSARLDADPSVRVVILRGAGTDAFVAGADISEFTDSYRPGTHEYNELVTRAYEGVSTISKPTIAQVHGFCVGGGLAIAASADFRVASSEARFGLPPARLGVGYSPAGLAQLVDLIGPGAVNEMVFTADLIGATTAASWGLVNHVVTADQLDDFVAAKAETIAQRAPMSIIAAKLSVKARLSGDPKDWLFANEAAAACLDSDDYLEGIAAFVEKRAASFKGS